MPDLNTIEARLAGVTVSDRVRKALEHVGLTNYETRAYSSLLASGPQNAQELSQNSGVPHSKIYETLASLEEKGWAASDDSRPTVYAAHSPTTGLESTRRSNEESFERYRKAIVAELEPLYEKSGTSEKPDILVLSGIANIATRIMEMIESCRCEVMIAMPHVGRELLNAALPKLRLLHDRGVTITILVSDSTAPDTVRSMSQVASVKIHKNLFGGGIISDQRYVIILLGQEAVKSDSGMVAIWADHAGLASFAREYFEYLINDLEALNDK